MAVSGEIEPLRRLKGTVAFRATRTVVTVGRYVLTGAQSSRSALHCCVSGCAIPGGGFFVIQAGGGAKITWNNRGALKYESDPEKPESIIMVAYKGDAGVKRGRPGFPAQFGQWVLGGHGKIQCSC